MVDASIRLKSIKVELSHLLLDPNNPRFAKSLNLRTTEPDKNIPAMQQQVEKLFVNERESEVGSDEDDSEVEEGLVRIGDLVRSMREIGFVPIDNILVRHLNGSTSDYVVIKGNRQVRSAKYLYEERPDQSNPEAKRKHEEILQTLKPLDVLLLETDGLTLREIQDQIGVILGLRHFGQVLGWPILAKAVNIYQEYMNIQPVQSEFKLDNKRISQVVTRLSQPRSSVMSALKTYVAYKQLQEAFPHGAPKPSHYSLLQACVRNSKLASARYIQQDGNTFKLVESSLVNVNIACEFESRDSQSEDKKILRDPKAVSAFAELVHNAASHPDAAIRAFATSLQMEVLSKARSLSDAIDNLRSFKSARVWTKSLEALLNKIAEPGSPVGPPPSVGENQRLAIEDFQPTGNDLLRLVEARNAFRNVRTIIGI